MADDADIIREYLVSLGFKLDQNSLNKFDSALVKTAKAAAVFATTLAGMATATAVFVEHVVSDMEDLYWSSVRLRDGVANIQDFKLAISKVGGTAQGALNALENMAAYLRTNPAGEGWLHQLGVQTRDAEGHLRKTTDIVKDFAHLPLPYWLKVRFAQRFGIDENTLQAIIRAAPEAEDAVTRLYKMAGLDADQAAKSSNDFMNKLRDIGATFGVVATVLEVRLLPMVNLLADALGGVAEVILTLDKWTGGLTTDFGLLAVAVWGINTAFKVTFGASLAQVLWKLAGTVALLAVETFPAFAEAIWAVGVAFSEGLIPGIWAATTAIVAFLATNPIGWIILLGVGLAGAATLIITNWDKVKRYFGSLVGWLRGKYNAVAKFLGLPKWEAGAKGPQHGQPRDSAAPQGGPDWKTRERDLGPNSLYGAEDQPANDHANKEITGKALAFFQRMGWTANQAAGIVANLIHESGLNPNAVGDNGQARGIAQWHKDRQAAFKAWAGHDIRNSTLDEQLAFVNHELTRGAEAFAGKMLMGAQNAADAGMRVSKYYERPADTTGQMAARGRTAANLVGGAKLAPNQGRGGAVTINQKTDIKVTGTEAGSTGRAVAREQGRVNGDLVRNFAGAQS